MASWKMDMQCLIESVRLGDSSVTVAELRERVELYEEFGYLKSSDAVELNDLIDSYFGTA